MQANLVVEIVGLAFEAVDALVRIDLSQRMNGLDGATPGANMAFRATFTIALEPFEHPHARGNGERGAEWAEVAAIEPFDEQSGEQEECRIDHKWPLAGELHRDRGLERLDFGNLECHQDRAQRKGEDADKYDVF